MFEGYKVVCVTPAGRRRYMKLLVPQVLSSPLVDRYDIWVNTPDAGDLAFFDGLARLDPRINLVRHPDGKPPAIESIGSFHRTACDPDTIYIRLDDDIVWLEPGFFETLLRFRVDHPEFFLVMPLIINNAVCSFLLQSFGKIAATQHLRPACMDEFGWRDPYLALDLHRLLIGLIERGETRKLHVTPCEIALNRFSINSLCWFGKAMAPFAGKIGKEEEEELSLLLPMQYNLRNCFVGNTIAAHYAFIFQRDKVDRSGILEEYRRVLFARAELRPLLEQAEAIAAAADAAHADALSGLYVPPPVPLRHELKVWWRQRPWRKQWKPKARLRPGYPA
jgi:hypothetical protein